MNLLTVITVFKNKKNLILMLRDTGPDLFGSGTTVFRSLQARSFGTGIYKYPNPLVRIYTGSTFISEQTHVCGCCFGRRELQTLVRP